MACIVAGAALHLGVDLRPRQDQVESLSARRRSRRGWRRNRRDSMPAACRAAAAFDMTIRKDRVIAARVSRRVVHNMIVTSKNPTRAFRAFAAHVRNFSRRWRRTSAVEVGETRERRLGHRQTFRSLPPCRDGRCPGLGTIVDDAERFGSSTVRLQGVGRPLWIDRRCIKDRSTSLPARSPNRPRVPA